ncbi:MAG: hypothetical protein HC834_02425, partial [Rhodospirillales bacterium]|nr:hypothetical protein [Rhodospirillales bacterium]
MVVSTNKQAASAALPSARRSVRGSAVAERVARVSSRLRRGMRLMRTFAAVTTCHAEGYEAYGRDMIASFEAHWPKSVPIYVYREGFEADIFSPRIIWRDLLKDCPDLVAFKQRHKNNPVAHGLNPHSRWQVKFRVRRPTLRVRKVQDWGAGFRWDAVRFSHKSYSVFDAARRCDADVMFWIDADTFTFNDLPISFLEEVMPPDCIVSYLHRPRYSECGLVGYNLRHPGTAKFLDEFERLYTSDALFQEKEFHDSYLFDVVRKRFERQGYHTYDISEGRGGGRWARLRQQQARPVSRPPERRPQGG